MTTQTETPSHPIDPGNMSVPGREGYRVRCSQQRTPGIDTGSYVSVAWPEVPTLEAARELLAALKAEAVVPVGQLSSAPREIVRTRRNWAIFKVTYFATIECVEQDA
jgi:hypothetical protein